MNKMTTGRVLRDLALNESCGQPLVDWALNMMGSGNDTPSIRLLAGAVRPYNHFELAELRDNALAELNIQVPPKNVAMGRYAAERLREAQSEGDEYRAAIVELKDLCIRTSYDDALYPFYMIFFSMEDLKDLGYSMHLTEVTNRNIKAFIEKTVNETLQKYG